MKTIKYAALLVVLVCFQLRAQELYDQPEGTRTKWFSFENSNGDPGKGGMENKGGKGHAFDVVPAEGSRVMMNYKGAGVIRRIWLTVNERSAVMLRSMRLEMYWDDATTPAVSAPLGDFFGIGLGRRVAFESEFFSDPEGRSFNCTIPMPFKTGARIIIVNESKTLVTLFYDIDVTAVDKHTKPIYYFHAYWNRSHKTELGKDFIILPAVTGKGRFLGMNVGVIADSVYEKSWWGEGEVKVFLDGDSQFPTLVGTGTEDYIGSAWGLGAFAKRYQGCPIADPPARQWSFYRYHVPDPIYFQSQCKVSLQQIGGEMMEVVRELKKKGAPLIPISVAGPGFHKILDMNPVPDINDPKFPTGWTNYYRQDDYSATAYFYLDKPTNGLPAIAGVSERTARLK